MGPRYLQTPQQLSTSHPVGTRCSALGPLALIGAPESALCSAAGTAAAASSNRWTGVVNPLHFPAKAKRVIWLYMAGGMSHLETFDPKPKLTEMHGQPMPESITKGQQIAQLQGPKAELLCAAARVQEVREVGARDQHRVSAAG